MNEFVDNVLKRFGAAVVVTGERKDNHEKGWNGRIVCGENAGEMSV